VLGTGSSIGIYFKDNKGKWKWTDGKRTLIVPESLLRYMD